jgi:ankyrin repeat protein
MAAHAVLQGNTWLLMLLLLLLLLRACTALHMAADKGNKEVVKQLLGAGAAVNTFNKVRPPPELDDWLDD